MAYLPQIDRPQTNLLIRFENFDGRHFGRVDGEVFGGPAVVGLEADVGAEGQQLLDGGQVALAGRGHQRRHSSLRMLRKIWN